MPRRRAPHPTDAEMELLGVLWKVGPSSLGAVYNEVNRNRQVARTTVATMLGVMLHKKLVRRNDTPAAGYLWSAAVTRTAAARGMVAKLIDAVFEGSARRMVTHLLEQEKLSPKERAEICELLAQPKKISDTRPQRRGGAT